MLKFSNHFFFIFSKKLFDNLNVRRRALFYLYLFHRTSIKNRNYHGTIGSSIINATISQPLINHLKDDNLKIKKKELNK